MKLKLAGTLGVLTALLLTSSALAAPLFKESPRGRVELGPQPSDLVAGYLLWGDSEDDFIVSLRGADRLALYEGTHEGFNRVATVPTDDQPAALTLSEGSWSRDLLSVATGEGVQVFEDPYDHAAGDPMRLRPIQSLDLGTAPADVTFSRFVFPGGYNDDPDLLVADPGSDSVRLFTGKAGTYSLESSFDVGADPFSIAAPESWGNPVAFLSRGAEQLTISRVYFEGSIQDPRTVPVGDNPVAVVGADFVPGDHGSFEFAVANQGSDDITLIDGPNATGDYAVLGSFPAGPNPSDLAATEVNRSRGVDLAVTNRGANTLTVLLNDGAGRFEKGGVLRTGRDPVAVIPLKANRYFSPDLAVLNSRSGDMSLFLLHPPGECMGRPAWLRTGTAGDDAMKGTQDPDSSTAGAGNDVVFTGGGPDCAFGGPGDDEIDTRDRADLALGGEGDDAIASGSNSDRVFGGAGDDYLRADYSDYYEDHVRFAGSDQVRGGPGADYIESGEPGDRIWGDRGNDRIVAQNSGRDVVDCGRGRDRVITADRVDELKNCERLPARTG